MAWGDHHLRQYVSGLSLFNYLKVRARGGLSQKQRHMASTAPQTPMSLPIFSSGLKGGDSSLPQALSYISTIIKAHRKEFRKIKLAKSCGLGRTTAANIHSSAVSSSDSHVTPGQASGWDSHARPAVISRGSAAQSVCYWAALGPAPYYGHTGGPLSNLNHSWPESEVRGAGYEWKLNDKCSPYPLTGTKNKNSLETRASRPYLSSADRDWGRRPKPGAPLFYHLKVKSQQERCWRPFLTQWSQDGHRWGILIVFPS